MYEKNDKVKDIKINDINESTFYDPLNRIADFICGVIADYDFGECNVSGEKQKKIIENVISDNNYIIIIGILERNIMRGTFEKSREDLLD